MNQRLLELSPIVAKDIVQRFKEGYFGDDMTLLTVSAHRAVQFIETWIELYERAHSAAPSVQGLSGKDPLL